MDPQQTTARISEKVLNGKNLDAAEYQAIVNLPLSHVPLFLEGANRIRRACFGSKVQLCTICNGKSGRCSEDCAFCSQSAFSQTEAPVYPLLGSSELAEPGKWASETPIHRYAVVTSGRRLPAGEVAVLAEALGTLDQTKIATCASLGILDHDDFKTLKNEGVSRYHHNLETAKSHFGQVCTTHTYQERVDCILKARQAGLSVCSGGIFGVGETDAQVLELALELKRLDVDAVPINFLSPIAGTPMAGFERVSPMRCLKIIALFRHVLPDKTLIVCGGRKESLKEHHSRIFDAGANGMMTGNYLTTQGRTLEKDLEMLDQLGLSVR